MNKFSEFYIKVMENDSIKKEFTKILGDKNIEKASENQLLKIGELAENIGITITLDEAKAYLNGMETELDEDDLDAVAGGGKGETHVKRIYMCDIGGQAGVDDDNFGPDAAPRQHG
ncbi:MAG: hypothetical protein ACI4JN_00985 [Ruminococcus sp.]